MPAIPSPPIRVRPTVRTVALLAPTEVYRGQVFHDGLLWEGHSSGAVADYRIDAHAADGLAVVASAAVPHTLEFLHPFGPGTILVVGKHFHPRRGWLTHHSTVRLDAGRGSPRLRVRTRTMPRHLQVEQFGGHRGAMYFNDPGARRIVRWDGWRARPLRPDVHFPGAMIVTGRHLYVLERNHFLPGQESIARIDLAAETIERTFAAPRRRLTTLLDLPGLPWIAAPEAWADQVLLVDRAANRLAAVLPVAGTPVAVARLGACLVAFAADALTMSFFDLGAEGFPLVAEWDLAGSADDLGNVRSLEVDPAAGNLFLRSPYHPRIGGNTPSVRVVSDPDGATLAACRGSTLTRRSTASLPDGRGAA